MPANVQNLSVGVFVRGLSNLKTMLTKAEAHATASGGDATVLLNARLDTVEPVQSAMADAPRDLHRYTLALQVHWAAEGAKLAIARLLDAPAAPAAFDERSFVDLQRHLDSTLTYLREIAPSDLEASLDRTIAIQLPRGSVSCSGGQFLLAYAIPHFYYHVTAAYGILRNQGVQLTMSDFLGNWGTN